MTFFIQNVFVSCIICFALFLVVFFFTDFQFCNLFIASWCLGVTFCVVIAMLYVLHRILGLQGTLCSIRTRVAPLCMADDSKSNGA